VNVPIRYELDDLLRRIVVTVDGPFQAEDIFAIMARQRAEHTWTYGTLYDLRGMIGEPTVEELRQLMSGAAELREEEGPRGRAANHTEFTEASDPIPSVHRQPPR
jgi:hypothetical protein